MKNNIYGDSTGFQDSSNLFMICDFVFNYLKPYDHIIYKFLLIVYLF